MYKVKKSDLKGQIKDFPIEVVQKMVEKQVHQGHKADVKVFQVNADSCWDGFEWARTIEGDSFWRNVICQADFPLFFEKYPKKKEKKELKGIKLLNEFEEDLKEGDLKKSTDELQKVIFDALAHPLEYGIKTEGVDKSLIYAMNGDKPSLGVMPKSIWDRKRIASLKEGIRRYLDADKDIPVDWVTEYNDLVKGKYLFKTK